MARTWHVRTNRKTKCFIRITNCTKNLSSLTLCTSSENCEGCTICFSTNSDANARCTFHERKCLTVKANIDSRCNCDIEKMIIKSMPWPHCAVMRKPVCCWPQQLSLFLPRNHSQAVNAMCNRMVNSQFIKRSDCARSETISTHFVATVRTFFEQGD